MVQLGIGIIVEPCEYGIGSLSWRLFIIINIILASLIEWSVCE